MMVTLALKLIDLVSWGLALLGRRRAVAVGRALGAFAFHVLRIRRGVVEQNLAHAFPEKTPAERRGIALGCYRQLGRILAEVLVLQRLSFDETRAMVRFVNEQLLHDVVASGQGAVVCLGHMGNWELMGFESGRRGYKFHAITKALQGTFNRRLHETRRKSFGELPPHGSFEAGLEVLKRGEFLALIIDQHSPSERAVVVDFFGRRAQTFPSPALFALRSGLPVLTAWMALADDGVYEVRIGGPFPVPDAPTLEERLVAHTQLLARELERAVRERPEQWFWVHRRWKLAEAEARAARLAGGST
jgi:KDO2-lipid IV(A) lauroyltransferase